MSSTWNNCLSRLENEIPSSDFNTWVRPLQAEEHEKHIKLFAPNRFVLDWVKQHYFAKFAQAVEEFSNGHQRLQLEIGSKANSNKTPLVTADEPPVATKKNPSFLNPMFTFERFIIGKSNQLATRSALQVSENIGEAYNPLFIYGHSGLGKTHLMHAIGNAIAHKKPEANIVYLHSEKFVHDMVKSLQNSEIDKFKTYYRNLDILLLDDIQFLAGKERSQEEFFHTFNHLLDKKHQIVITCDQYPKEILGLEERLQSRLGWGLPVTIEPPDLETRIAILMKKASFMGVNLPPEVAFFISKRIPSNIRELEGVLRRVIANAQLTGELITLEFTQETLHDLLLLQEKRLSIEVIQSKVSEYFNLKINDLTSKTRKQPVTRPRQLAMALARELTAHSYAEIGDAFGGRDHTTVMSACVRVGELRKQNPQSAEDYVNLHKLLSHP
jgi:chromosomal replication initiator protein